MGDIGGDIRSRGYYEIVIRPETFAKERVSYSELWPTLWKCAVSLTGWDFPHMGSEETVEHFADSIRQSVEWRQYREMWRFFQSGQLAYIGGVHEDWRGRGDIGRSEAEPAPGGLLGGQDVVTRFTEAYELAARLSNTPAGDDQMRVSVAIRGLAGRQLYMENPARHLSQRFRTDASEYVWEDTIERGRLLAEPRVLARSAARGLFERFGFNVHDTVLTELQATLRA